MTLEQNGYVVEKRIFSPNEIKLMRTEAERLTGQTAPPFLTTYVEKVFDESEVFRQVILGNVDLTQRLRMLLGGDYILADEHGLHDCNYFSKWHCDTTSPDWRGFNFRAENDFR
jgi:hypothetical protein